MSVGSDRLGHLLKTLRLMRGLAWELNGSWLIVGLNICLGLYVLCWFGGLLGFGLGRAWRCDFLDEVVMAVGTGDPSVAKLLDLGHLLELLVA